MTMLFDQACISSRRPAGLAWLAAVALLALDGCVLTGIEPDEIDVADGETGGDGAAEGDGDGDAGGDGDPTGDGDATTTGDGDGDPSTGDGDGDATGDGDGDPGTSGDGDGDGDPTGTGDGDGDPGLCADLQPAPVYDGDNAVVIAADAADLFQLSCGGPGPDALFVYESTHTGLVTFTLAQADFDAGLALVGPDCTPLTELSCDAASVAADLLAGELVYLVVDSTTANVGGSATLVVTGP